MKTEKREKTVWVDECPHCSLEIAGTSESQVNYNMRTHIKQKHKNKEEEEENE